MSVIQILPVILKFHLKVQTFNCPGVIRECGGKMHLRENEFDRAHTDFFEAFKNYDESGSPRRTTCLKYLVLANMLMKSGTSRLKIFILYL